VQFGLQFEEIAEPETKEIREAGNEAKTGPVETKSPAVVTPVPASGAEVSAENNASAAPGGAEVVRLDRFRKK
jgi:hypothetical protein